MQSLRDILARIARGETTPAGALAVSQARIAKAGAPLRRLDGRRPERHHEVAE